MALEAVTIVRIYFQFSTFDDINSLFSKSLKRRLIGNKYSLNETFSNFSLQISGPVADEKNTAFHDIQSILVQHS